MSSSLGLYGNCIILLDTDNRKHKRNLQYYENTLYDNIEKYDKNILYKIVKQWFATQLNDIKNKHILISNTDTTNIYYDENNGVLHFIDYSGSKTFKLYDILDEYKDDISYKFNPLDEHRIVTKNDKQIECIDNITDDDSKNIFIHQLNQFYSSPNATKLHEIIKSIYGIDECVSMYKKEMKTLGFDDKTINLFRDYIINYTYCDNTNKSIRNWLGRPFGDICSSHRILSYMEVYPDEFKKIYDEISVKNNPIYKMTRNEFRKWLLDNMKTYSPTYRQLANMLYFHCEPTTELINMKKWIQKNETNIETLYRTETTDRFADEMLAIGKTISWNNIISSTVNKDYAISFLNNARGSSFVGVSDTNLKNILFVFKNVNASLIHDDYSKETTYVYNYNAKNPKDKDRFNCFHTNGLIVSNEYVIYSSKPFVIKNINNTCSYYIIELSY